MKRRDFVKHTSHGLLLPGILGSLGVNPFGNSILSTLLNNSVDTDHVLVMIFLNGGNDGLNTVIPLDQMSALNEVRPQVVLPESKILKLKGESVGLHPSLTTFKDMFDDGRLKIVQNVGYPDPNFSHFRSTDIWMSASGSDRVVETGWAGRYLNYEYPNFPNDFPNATMPDPLAMEMGYLSSLMFQGPTGNLGFTINNPEQFYRLVENKEQSAPDTKAGRKLQYIRHIARQSQTYGERLKELSESTQNKAVYPEGNSLADQLKIVARLIAGGSKTRMYMVFQGGYDTHDNQANQGDHTLGEHADLLRDLNDAVKAFMTDMELQKADDRVMGMTFSEFGRRIVSNASNGTDHGHAAPQFIFGNAVEGGVLGNNPQIDKSMTAQDNLLMEFDFRQVYASLLEQWLCVEPDDISSILLGDFDPLSIAPNSDCMITAVHDANVRAGTNYISVSPNPLNGLASVEFTSLGETLSIDLIDVQGKVVRRITQGNYARGQHQVSMDTSDLKPGTYFCRIQSRSINQSKQVVKFY